jgi:hypothetical protein
MNIKISDSKSSIYFLANVEGQQLLSRFSGRSINGAIRVVEATFHKNGKWSYSAYNLEVADDIKLFTVPEFRQGEFPSWDALLMYFNNHLSRFHKDSIMTMETFQRYYRNREDQRYVKTLDENASVLEKPSQLAELLAAQAAFAEAQNELAKAKAEVQEHIKAREIADAASSVRQDTQRIKDALIGSKSMSLADLKAILIN